MLETTAVFIIGAVIYGAIELFSRGWTHWSMLLAGGVCVSTIYYLSNYTHLPLWKKMILSSVIVTTVEYISGIILNIRLGWHIWDYSDRAMNLMGQICPTYSLIWLGLSVPGIWICKKLHILFHQ